MTLHAATGFAAPPASLASFVEAVQHNCDVSDARHAREGALCTYLLGMREFYRWRSGAAPGAALVGQRVGAFIAEREAAWDRIDDEAPTYRDLPLDGGVQPFDEARVDALPAARGLVYGAGVGRFGAPVFFLAERLRETTHGDVHVVYAGTEFARGVVAPPAASRGKRIVVRTDALRRWLWTRAEAGRLNAQPWGLAALIAASGSTPHEAIERIVAEQAETLALHEIGELRAGALLGPDWEHMLMTLEDRQAELAVRAVRDLLADCLVTLPQLAARNDARALHFWRANFEGLRRMLAPRLGALVSTNADGHGDAIAAACLEEGVRLRALASDLLARWRHGEATEVRATVRTMLAGMQAA